MAMTNNINNVFYGIILKSKWEGRVHAGNTTYTADSHPNSTKFLPLEIYRNIDHFAIVRKVFDF